MTNTDFNERVDEARRTFERECPTAPHFPRHEFEVAVLVDLVIELTAKVAALEARTRPTIRT